MQSAAHIIVRGRVQGVGFRWFIVTEARELNLVGWVRNLPDGSVEIDVEGDKEAVERLIEKAHQGPMFAKVTDVAVEELPYRGQYETFTVG